MKYTFKGTIDEWTEDGHFKTQHESYYINSKNVDIDRLRCILKFLEEPKKYIDKEYIKKCIDEI